MGFASNSKERKGLERTKKPEPEQPMANGFITQTSINLGAEYPLAYQRTRKKFMKKERTGPGGPRPVFADDRGVFF
jgi:hypothetical protein